MSRRTAGVICICIAALLLCTRYLTAAIYRSGVVLNNTTFDQVLHDIGGTLTTWSIVSLVVGIVYLIFAEWKENKKN
ncbi:hypothetical protein [Paenibacillus kandeliae]|uniref:hypothetical protein n=1 Tax=Paenibacillus kandeliae TaxID=3231269 RepID=UPI0034581698